MGAVKLPREVARFNKTVNNRIQGIYAWVLPPWAVIVHRGRHSGRTYRTPVRAFRRDRTLIVALLYGDQSDWLRNLRAGGGRLVRAGRTFEIVGEPDVVATPSASELATLSPLGRAYCRLAGHQALITIGAESPGFGVGPRASP